MKLVMMLNKSSAQMVSEIGIEQWLKANRASPLLVVIREEGHSVKRVWDLDNTTELPLEMFYPKQPPSGSAPNPIQLHPTRLQVLVNTREIELNRKEYALLRFLMTYQGRTFSKFELYQKVWKKPCCESKAYTVVVHINRLRNKIENDSTDPIYIQTVRGVGYRFQQNKDTLCT